MNKFKMTPAQMLDMAREVKREETLEKFEFFAVAKSMNTENMGKYQECLFCGESRSRRDGAWLPWESEIQHKPDCLYAEIIGLIMREGGVN